MDKYTNVFDAANIPSGGDWISFENIGDKYAGELIQKYESEDGYKNIQTVYVLQTADGIKKYGTHKEYVNSRLATAGVGDIIGFEYTGDYEGKLGVSKTIIPYLMKGKPTE